jgi:hypothetical protein
MLTHIVLFKLHDPATSGPELRARLLELPAQIPEIRLYEVGLDVTRGPRSYDLALLSGFESAEDLSTYVAHPAHQELVGFIEEVCETRVAVDYIQP